MGPGGDIDTASLLMQLAAEEQRRKAADPMRVINQQYPALPPEMRRAGVVPDEIRETQPRDLTMADILKGLAHHALPETTARRISPLIDARQTISDAMYEYGPAPAKVAVDVAKQPIRAGEAVAEAANDPTLPNITNAGMQSALAVAKPVHALKVLGAGYGVAGAKQLGLDDIITEAMAQGKPKPALKGSVHEPAATAAPADDPLDPSQRQRLGELQRKQSRGATLTRAEREEQNGYLDVLSKASVAKATAKTSAEAEKRKAEQDEYDRAVRQAETERDRIKATDKSFKDSPMGQVYEKTGGYLPALLAFGGGATRATAKGLPTTAKDIGLTAAEGTGLAFSAMNAPLVYDAFSTPVKNPTREAMLAYATSLPPGHPRKKEFMDAAAAEDPLNPVSKRAWDEITSVPGMGRRLLAAGYEGAPAALTGALVPTGVKEGIKGVASVPGLIQEGYQVAQGRAAAAKTGRYGSEADAGAKRVLAADNRVLALESEAAAAEAQRRLAGQKAGGVQPAPAAQAQPAPPVAPPPQPAAAANPPPALPPPINKSNNVPASPQIRKVANSQDKEKVLTNLAAGRPPGDGLADLDPARITDIVDRFSKWQQITGADYAKMLKAGPLKWGVAVGGAVGAAAYEDGTSPTGARHPDGRFAPKDSLDAAIDKAMGDRP